MQSKFYKEKTPVNENFSEEIKMTILIKLVFWVTYI